MESNNKIVWQELIESKDFDQLSNEEKSFVLGISNEASFHHERAVIVEARRMNDEIEPKPLILQEEKKGVVVPLYQTALAVAASFILAFFLFRSNGTSTETKKESIIASTDTVYVEKYIIDTVLQTKTEYVKMASKKAEPREIVAATTVDNPSAVLSSQTSFEADLSSTTLANKGTSASNDETLILMESWVEPN